MRNGQREKEEKERNKRMEEGEGGGEKEGGGQAVFESPEELQMEQRKEAGWKMEQEGKDKATKSEPTVLTIHQVDNTHATHKEHTNDKILCSIALSIR